MVSFTIITTRLIMDDIFKTDAYRSIATDTITETINFLFDSNKEFSLACETDYLTFSPDLPTQIKDTFGKSVLFILTGYTYESAQMDDDYFSFEAGFGEDNFGSTVSLPILAIKQIFVDDYPIVINITEPTLKESNKDTNNIDTSKSMEALLNNPENKKFLKN